MQWVAANEMGRTLKEAVFLRINGGRLIAFLTNMGDWGFVIRSARFRVLQNYHLDISKIQRYRKAELSAMSVNPLDAKISRNIGWIRNHMVMVDAGEISGNRASV